MNKIINNLNILHDIVYSESPDLDDLKIIYASLVKSIIEFYKLPIVEINFNNINGNNAIGSYNPYTNNITINSKFLDPAKIPTKQDLDYYFAELIHTAFHEPRHYLQYQFLKEQIDLPEIDKLKQLSDSEKKVILKELLNSATDDVLYITDGKIKAFPFFYYSKFHEKDAVSTSIKYMKEIIDNLDKEVAQDLKNGLTISLKYWDKIYNEDTLFVAAQKNLKTYKTKETIFGLKNIPINENEIINIAMHEYLPISKALTEFNLLKFNGLEAKSMKLGKYDIDVSINNNTWFLQLSKPFENDDLGFCIMIKDNQCCLFRADMLCKLNQDMQILEEVFDISKAFSKVYSELTGSMIDTYVVTPILGIYPEMDRQKLLSNVAKSEKLEYIKEPNVVFIRSYFNATAKTPYVSSFVSNVKEFILSNKITLDKKLDDYEKLQVAHTIPKEINNLFR